MTEEPGGKNAEGNAFRDVRTSSHKTVITCVHRVVLASLLLVAYLYAWTPARTAWVAYGAGPLLEQVAKEARERTRVTVRPDAQTLRVERANGQAGGHAAPAGVKFLLPALILVGARPQRPGLWHFLGGHVLLGALVVSLLAGGAVGGAGAMGVADFVESYVVDAYSLGMAVFILGRD